MSQGHPSASADSLRAAVARDSLSSVRGGAATLRAIDLFERLVPNPDPASNSEDRVQARILAGLGVVFLGIAVVAIYINGFYGHTPLLVNSCAIGAFGVGLLIAVRFRVRPRPLGHVAMWVIYAESVGVTIVSGGGAVTAVFTASTIPLLAAVLDKPANVKRWTIAALVGVGFAAVYASTTDSYLVPVSMSVWHRFRFLIVAASLLLVYAGTLILEWARNKAVVEARLSKVELTAQSERYRSLVENVGDVMMEFDRKGQCIFMSANCADVTGRTPIELTGEGLREHVHPDDLDVIQVDSKELKSRVGETRRTIARYQHAAGHWIHGQLTTRSFRLENGDVHFVSIFRDVTELRTAELRMRHNERLATAGTLAAGIAHQINNPIGSIRNSSEYALLCVRDGDLSPIESVLHENIEQATRCGEIVRSLLRFASREAPQMLRQDLAEIVGQARDLTRSYGQERGIEIDFSPPVKPVWVNASAIEIQQVVLNLLRNAVEAAPESKRVSVAVSRRGGIAHCMVRDDGRGISEVDRAHVFDPFFTTRIRDGGSGLGLSVAHGIVRDHGGSMTLDSMVGKGTTVCFELPIHPELLPS